MYRDKARDEDKILVIDLIVPSCVMTLVMGDKTDDLKNKLAIQVGIAVLYMCMRFCLSVLCMNVGLGFKRVSRNV